MRIESAGVYAKESLVLLAGEIKGSLDAVHGATARRRMA